ncbi:hypothetical protein V6N11_007799 [Hibiscus sabdariffa]|uniref:Uncharacterized protein n=2 Tax=Hibiscus sabdariffa TaxID=183260 RepID=A0ABR1Z998_9ROSI
MRKVVMTVNFCQGPVDKKERKSWWGIGSSTLQGFDPTIKDVWGMGFDKHLSPCVSDCVEEVRESDWASQVDRANSKLERSQTNFVQDQSVLTESPPSGLPFTMINNNRLGDFEVLKIVISFNTLGIDVDLAEIDQTIRRLRKVQFDQSLMSCIVMVEWLANVGVHRQNF